MKVKIRQGKLPPNYAQVAAHFPLQGNEVFTYGDTIYTPGHLSKAVLEHEKVHVRQQQRMGPANWWERYLIDPDFRLQQELQAHRKEWQVGGNLHAVASRLTSPIYGNLVDYLTARQLITGDKV